MSGSTIAQAAAHAELQHLGWEEVDFGHVRKTFSCGAMGDRGLGLSDEEANSRFDRKADKIIEQDL